MLESGGASGVGNSGDVSIEQTGTSTEINVGGAKSGIGGGVADNSLNDALSDKLGGVVGVAKESGNVVAIRNVAILRKRGTNLGTS